MKTIASILILLMLAMAFAPCADASEESTSQTVDQISTSIVMDAVDNDCKTEKQEACSPICTCQCCPSINSYALDFSGQIIIFPFTHLTEENFSFSSNTSFIIWSPPQFLS